MFTNSNIFLIKMIAVFLTCGVLLKNFRKLLHLIFNVQQPENIEKYTGYLFEKKLC